MNDPTRPWPEMAVPTAEQWTSGFLASPPPEQLRRAQMVLKLGEQASRCFLNDHEGSIETASIRRHAQHVDHQRQLGRLHLEQALNDLCHYFGLNPAVARRRQPLTDDQRTAARLRLHDRLQAMQLHAIPQQREPR